MKPVEQVPAKMWQNWADENEAFLLDVRQPEEWAQGTLPEATLLSITEITERIGEIPKNRAILCICRSGGRSQQVAAFLTSNGYEDVANLAGGMKALGMQD